MFLSLYILLDEASLQVHFWSSGKVPQDPLIGVLKIFIVGFSVSQSPHPSVENLSDLVCLSLVSKLKIYQASDFL